MKTFEDLRREVNTALQTLPELQGKPAELYAPIVYTLEEGGKRLRPVMCLMACALFKGDTAAALPPALGLEVFHNFTLLHDDVMDRADIRRGRPTVHVKWNDNTAVLSGDAMFAVATSLVSQAPQAVLPQVMQAFNRLAVGVCEGQQYDMNFETQHDVTMDEYMEMIRLKTAVLLAGSLEIGALLAGAPQSAVQSLYQFGIQIGLAFQLQDDLLDLYADEAKFGKKIGSDIRENKKTYLYLRALELLSDADCHTLVQLFRTETVPQNEAEKIARVRALYDKVDIQLHTNREITRLFTEATRTLSAISQEYMDKTDNAALQLLKDFTAKLLEREY